MKKPRGIRFNIAGIIVSLESRFPLEADDHLERASDFIYRGKRPSDMVIEVEPAAKLPSLARAERLFRTIHYDNGEENWSFWRRGRDLIYACPLQGKEHVVFLDQDFARGRAFLINQRRDRAWKASYLVYDFLQVLLIAYLARRGSGVILHSAGVKDGKKGFLFAGKSGAGKSTSSRIWHESARATVLNDDRIIIRKAGRRFLMHAAPWHGEFNDYLADHIRPVRLDHLFIIHHAARNKAEPLGPAQAFSCLYPALFPVFWDKELLGSQVSFCASLTRRVPCWRMGWVNDARVIGFVRAL